LPRPLGCGKKEEPRKKNPRKRRAPAPTPAPETVVKIGHVGPLTGSIAHLGKDNENLSVRLAIDEANAKGVTIDGKKIKFELVAEDDQADRRSARRSRKAGRCEGRRYRRPPEFGRHDSGVGDL
jgi:branched-chain amino acid transport system substrate-binding protein